MTSSKIKKSII